MGSPGEFVFIEIFFSTKDNTDKFFIQMIEELYNPEIDNELMSRLYKKLLQINKRNLVTTTKKTWKITSVAEDVDKLETCTLLVGV